MQQNPLSFGLARIYTTGDGWNFSINKAFDATGVSASTLRRHVVSISLPDGKEVNFLCDNSSGRYINYHTRDGQYSMTYGLQHFEITNMKDNIVYQYDMEGRLIQIVKAEANSLDVEYLPDQNQIKISSPSGQAYIYTLNASGRIISLTNPAGGVILYAYDANGRLSTVTDESGVITGSYTYDAAGKLISDGDSSILYDQNGNLSAVVDANGGRIDYSYNLTSNSVETVNTDRKGNTVKYTYNNRKQVVSAVDSDGGLISYTYDSKGNLLSVTDKGQTTTYTYDGNGFNTCVEYPDGATEENVYYTWDLHYPGYTGYGQLIRSKDREGTYTYFYRNGNTEIQAVLKSLAGGELPPAYYSPSLDQSKFEITQRTYTSGNMFYNNELVSTETAPDGTVTAYTYDNYGNTVQTTVTKQVTGEDGTSTTETSTTISVYDGMHNLLTQTADGKTSVYIYDAAGRVLRENNDGKITRNIYDSKGRLVQKIELGRYVAADDGLNAATPVNTYANPNVGHRYVYAANGNLTSETNANGLTTNYTYDQFGNMASQSFDAYTFQHTVKGNVSSAKIGTQELASYDYSSDAKQLLNAVTYANGQAVNYTYTDGKVTGIKLDGDSAFRFEYAYDEAGEMAQKVDRTANLKYVFTTNDVKVYDISGETETLTHSYTLNSDLFTETVNGTGYSREKLENRDKFALTESASLNKAYTRDGDDRLTSARVYQLAGETETTSFTTDYTYGAEDRVTAISHILNGTAITLGYTYDADGNVTGVTQNGVGTSYVYDANRQLIRVNDGQQNKTVAYAYDTRGNIVSRSEYAFTTGDLTGVTPDLTVPYTYGDSGWVDLLTAYDGKAITYDANGNRISYDGWSYVWEAGRQLRQLSKGTDTFVYTYDDNGIRQTKTINGVTTRYSTIDGVITSQTDGINTLYFRYDSDDQLFGFNLNGTEYLYVLNLQGDVIAITDVTGTVVVQYVYDAWGKVVSVTGTLADTVGLLNPMRYRGYYYDTETGFYYLQSRYYDPEIGRFINADDAAMLLLAKDYIAGVNLFAYCYNNPVNRIDPTGKFSIPRWIAAMTIDALIWMYLGAFAVSWGITVMPVKFMGKQVAANWITKTFVPVFVRGFLNPVLTGFRKIMMKGFGMAISGAVSWTISNFLKTTVSKNIDIVLSIGGFIAGFADYITDGRLDGKIKVW